ncbi:hypothetical protein CVIRNUC_003636 [Coccomyxa viridis]|uniref:Extracellular protein n=1 Tax=Coccomyxa viridis TaxID=1274662 RepID=A0AAV1I0U8_9CHLO|nr:hypothetical protein CVIRNUC_003636 [Coccomyxa viridis]
MISSILLSIALSGLVSASTLAPGDSFWTVYQHCCPQTRSFDSTAADICLASFPAYTDGTKCVTDATNPASAMMQVGQAINVPSYCSCPGSSATPTPPMSLPTGVSQAAPTPVVLTPPPAPAAPLADPSPPAIPSPPTGNATQLTGNATPTQPTGNATTTQPTGNATTTQPPSTPAAGDTMPRIYLRNIGRTRPVTGCHGKFPVYGAGGCYVACDDYHYGIALLCVHK